MPECAVANNAIRAVVERDPSVRWGWHPLLVETAPLCWLVELIGIEQSMEFRGLLIVLDRQWANGDRHRYDLASMPMPNDVTASVGDERSVQTGRKASALR